MSADDVLNIISRVVAAMLRRRRVSEDKIAEFTGGDKEFFALLRVTVDSVTKMTMTFSVTLLILNGESDIL